MTSSSRSWLSRQVNDPYVALAKENGYRSRAAFKLIEINNKYKILKAGQAVIDLGCAPGSWLQVIASIVKNGLIIGLDLQDVTPVEGAKILKGDFSDDSTINALKAELNGKLVDVVLSDLAAKSCGITSVDHLRIMQLVCEVFDFCTHVMKQDGCMVAKVLRGGTERELLTNLKNNFSVVRHFKPNASRKDSAEMYVVAIGYSGPK